MRIEFERSGGVAGMRLRAAIDSASLPPDQARELDDLVTRARLDSVPAVGRGSRGADRFQYRLTVDRAGDTHTVVVDESAVPPSLAPLLDWLTKAARSGTGQAP